jgi:hypothetical protein
MKFFGTDINRRGRLIELLHFLGRRAKEPPGCEGKCPFGSKPEVAGRSCVVSSYLNIRHLAAPIGRHPSARRGNHGYKRQGTRDISLALADRRRPLRRSRMILVVLGENRLKGFLGPKFRRADVFQTGSVPI